ncbi:hypothetical protein [Bacillus tuaregi]|nr:hypothetical protein [Bacillus tuaregi]
MTNQPSNKRGRMNNKQGSGSQYHKEHAGNVQGYGSNNVDVNENGRK